MGAGEPLDVWLTMTPISEPWIYKDIYLKGMQPNTGVKTYRMSIYDNPHISKEGIEQFARTVAEDYRKSRLLGEFLYLQGRVFKSFDRHHHVINGYWPDDSESVYMGVDPHVYGRKNQAALWCTITRDGDVIFFSEIWKDLRIEELRDKIIEHDYVSYNRKRFNIKARVIDTARSMENDPIFRDAESTIVFSEIADAVEQAIAKPGVTGKSAWQAMTDATAQASRDYNWAAHEFRDFYGELSDALRQAGYDEARSLFSREAVKKIYEFTQGYPRQIALICHNAMEDLITGDHEIITGELIDQIIAKEKPDSLLLSFGGQTALNLGLELEKRGILKRYQVDVTEADIGAVFFCRRGAALRSS